MVCMGRWRIRRRESLANPFPMPGDVATRDAWQLPWRDLVAAARRFDAWRSPFWPAWLAPAVQLRAPGGGSGGPGAGWDYAAGLALALDFLLERAARRG
eukprot:5466749-Alexandrium_andersonii.AAC.1